MLPAHGSSAIDHRVRGALIWTPKPSNPHRIQQYLIQSENLEIQELCVTDCPMCEWGAGTPEIANLILCFKCNKCIIFLSLSLGLASQASGHLQHAEIRPKPVIALHKLQQLGSGCKPLCQRLMTGYNPIQSPNPAQSVATNLGFFRHRFRNTNTVAVFGGICAGTMGIRTFMFRLILTAEISCSGRFSVK